MSLSPNVDIPKHKYKITNSTARLPHGKRADIFFCNPFIKI
jgi:hypothetical protein